MYADEIRSTFCEVAGITTAELATKEWAGRLGVIFSEIGQPIIKAATRVSKGRSVPIREWTSKLRKRLKTDIPERERIAELKSALAERFYEIQTKRAAQLTKSRAAVGAKRREPVVHRVRSARTSRMAMISTTRLLNIQKVAPR
ncbi:MAG: hypothetical protein WBE69_04715 [Candidatus Binataceae bacterium]|jgi:hypothetical protein